MPISLRRSYPAVGNTASSAVFIHAIVRLSSRSAVTPSNPTKPIRPIQPRLRCWFEFGPGVAEDGPVGVSDISPAGVVACIAGIIEGVVAAPMLLWSTSSSHVRHGVSVLAPLALLGAVGARASKDVTSSSEGVSSLLKGGFSSSVSVPSSSVSVPSSSESVPSSSVSVPSSSESGQYDYTRCYRLSNERGRDKVC